MPIRRASRDYNSDYMSRKCDKELERLEDKLTSLYKTASKEVEQDYNDWISQYKKKDEEMRSKVDSGEITEDAYISWRDRTMLKDADYKATLQMLTDVLTNTDIMAMALVRNELPLVIAESYNFTQSLGFKAADEAGLSVGTFQIYNARTVQAIVRDNPDILPSVDLPEDEKWNKDHINREITQGIIQGDSIPKVAERLQNVTNMDKNAAIRNARTSMTSAENLGRNEGFHELKNKGIPCKFQWSATHDGRTRDTHILLDGTYQDDNGYFGVGIIDTPLAYPGDPMGDASEIYNCRCRASLRLEGIDHSQDGDLYEKFMQENYPNDWEKVKEQRAEKEAEYQKKAEQAAERVEARRERKEEEQTVQEEEKANKEVVNVQQTDNEPKTDEKPKEFTEKQKEAIEYYVSGDGMELNNMLRGRAGVNKSDLTATDKERIKALDEALDRKVEDKVLYRSVDASAIFGRSVDPYELIDEMLWGTYSNQKGDYAQQKAEKIHEVIDNTIGRKFVDPGYVSTTRDEQIARNWGDFTGSSNPIVLEIIPSENTRGADISQATEYIKMVEEEEGQKETLLARDQEYKIVDIYTNSRKVYVKIEME